jgi:hypothetical protein
VISRHNEIRDTLADSAFKALIPSTVRNEPLFHTSCPAVKMPDLENASNPPVTCNLQKNRDDLREYLLIIGFSGRGTACIIDVHVANTDAKSYLSKDPA